jgi:hypothetical protein
MNDNDEFPAQTTLRGIWLHVVGCVCSENPDFVPHLRVADALAASDTITDVILCGLICPRLPTVRRVHQNIGAINGIDR